MSFYHLEEELSGLTRLQTREQRARQFKEMNQEIRDKISLVAGLAVNWKTHAYSPRASPTKTCKCKF